jgi:hypothetical protein
VTGVDWPTVASLATALGTLVLAFATFAAVRSANRAARAAERSLLAGLRPLLSSARPQDPPQKVLWIDRHFARAEGGRAVVEVMDDVIYLAAAVRNSGNGLALLHGWYPYPARKGADEAHEPLTVDILYGDHEGGQRAIARFALTPWDEGYLFAPVRYWNIDLPDPR